MATPYKKEHSKTKKIHIKDSMNWKRYNTALSRGETETNSHKACLLIATKKDDPDTTLTQRILNSAAAWKIKDCTRQSIALQQIHLCCISGLVWAKLIQLQPLHQYSFSETAKDTLQDALKNINASKPRWKLWSGARFWAGSTDPRWNKTTI